MYHISGSEIGTILGFNPYETPLELYGRKIGLLPPKEKNESMRWGIEAEHVVARRYARQTGVQLFPSVDQGYDRHQYLTHPDYPWWTGTPDRKILPNGLLEIKIIGERSVHLWGEPPDGEIPDSYLMQIHWYMPLINADYADLAVQIGNRDYRVYRIMRDREMEETLYQAAEDFLNNHLIPQIPPPVDASEGARRYLHARYPKDEEEPIAAPKEALEWFERLRLAKELIANDEADKLLAENKLKEIIGGHIGIAGYGYKATWKKNKDTQIVNWQEAFNDLAALMYTPDELKTTIINEYTTSKPSPRILRVTKSKE